jgi:hypothetical protein
MSARQVQVPSAVRQTTVVRSAFETVIWVVCGLGIVFALFALIGSGKTWEDFGKGRFLLDSDPGGRERAVNAVERDTEIRQLLEARNARRLRRGETPIDVEQELRRLTAPLIDESLRQEIRDLVIARNHRRVRAGKPPLDVEAEIEREISELSNI